MLHLLTPVIIYGSKPLKTNDPLRPFGEGNSLGKEREVFPKKIEK
jgi:hypothetical protein